MYHCQDPLVFLGKVLVNVLALTEGRQLLAMGKSQDCFFFQLSGCVGFFDFRKTNAKFK